MLVDGSQSGATIGEVCRRHQVDHSQFYRWERLVALTAAIERVEEEIANLFHMLPYEPKDLPVGDITSLATLISEIEDIHRFSTFETISLPFRLVSSKFPD